MPAMRPGLPALLTAAVLGGGLATGGSALLGEQLAGGRDAVTTVVQAPVAEGRAVGVGLPSAREVYEAAAPSVAFVEATVVRRSASPFGPPEAQAGRATGSGFAVRADGLVLTNAHVVEGARDLRVTLGDAGARPAELVAIDPSTDLALLRVDLPAGSRAEPLELGATGDVAVGDTTYAIGSPFGLEQTLTTGVVSAKQRRIEAPDGTAIEDVLQTDAAINPGNSGGPLLDAQGRVIGVNSQIASSSGGSLGIGFAVPSETVERFLAEAGTALDA